MLGNTLQRGSLEEIKVIRITLEYKHIRRTLAGKLCMLLADLVQKKHLTKQKAARLVPLTGSSAGGGSRSLGKPGCRQGFPFLARG